MRRRRLDTLYAYIARYLPKNPQGENAVKRLVTLSRDSGTPSAQREMEILFLGAIA